MVVLLSVDHADGFELLTSNRRRYHRGSARPARSGHDRHRKDETFDPAPVTTVASC